MKGCVEVFDSVYSDLSPDTNIQLSTIYTNFTNNDVLEVEVVPGQHQSGSVDCGLFAIAWAYELANGHRPEHVMLEQSKMRSHLLACFQKQKINRFPVAN
ncbi:Hypothetical predicted protein [Paramuricea clavata]|uniref:Uncharacterized protein n=1 Tax=Paramuricea clavata TaxID=317549 RepID=A0A7D9DYH2_PARCT|nr:Hypothetical predicted protein [Paramuricea clavata]